MIINSNLFQFKDITELFNQAHFAKVLYILSLHLLVYITYYNYAKKLWQTMFRKEHWTNDVTGVERVNTIVKNSKNRISNTLKYTEIFFVIFNHTNKIESSSKMIYNKSEYNVTFITEWHI